MVQTFDMSRRDNSTNKNNNHGQGLDHHVKKGKRGACKQKASTVLPDRTAATLYIYSSLSSFVFDIVGYGVPHNGKVPRVGCTHVGLSQKLGDT